MLNLLDFITTLVGLSRGLVEANPLYYTNPTLLFTLKLVGFPLVVITCSKIVRKYGGKYVKLYTYTLYAIALLYTITLINNTINIIYFSRT